VTNLAYATGSFNIKSIISPSAIAIVRYEQSIKKEDHNEEDHNGDRDNYSGPGYGSHGDAVIPKITGPRYGKYGSEPSATTMPSEPNKSARVKFFHRSVTRTNVL
jgi:hypothetical protein